jgi:hypothetical protein
MIESFTAFSLAAFVAGTGNIFCPHGVARGEMRRCIASGLIYGLCFRHHWH